MKLRMFLAAAGLVFQLAQAAPFSTNANRLTYLDAEDPFYVGRDFPRLITPQWVGEEDVDAVVILAIDDMRETPKYETVLRPILERLKKIDGRAPVSIMVNTLPGTTNNAGGTSSANLQLQAWLKEGVTLDVHTIRHPCPLCQASNFTAAAATYHDCVDLMSSIPGNKPVAFRMPCCDSMNSPTPRFYSEIFNRTSPQGHFLTIDSSVMVILTTNDTSLPRELVMDRDGRERFRKYLPTETNTTTRVSMGSFTTTIEDYPYPYVIGKTCWEFPCIVPSDWEANNLHSPNNPKTVEDWERALDAIVLKQGVMTFIFHPHGWIKPEQMVEFVDYAANKYGKRVKFLNFREAHERLQRNLLAGQLLRRSDDGGDNGVRVIDVNNDGFLDVILGFQDRRVTRVWEPGSRTWRETDFPLELIKSDPAGRRFDAGARFGVVHPDRNAVIAAASEAGVGVWRFDGERWTAGNVLPGLLKAEGIVTERGGIDQGARFRDVDHDGVCEFIISNPQRQAIYKWNEKDRTWTKMELVWPAGTSCVDEQGRDAGLRFVDVDGDGFDDLLFSNQERYSLHLFRKDDRKLRLKPGWSDEIVTAKRGNPITDPIPPIVRDGTNRNNGVWFARSTMWIQNEDTAHLPDKVDRRTFKQLLSAGQPRAKGPEESLHAMRVRPGFKVELVASEPLIQSPVAFEWSADGRLWVVEMGDYPSGADGKGGGRVRVLEDTDADGKYDRATTFLDALTFPNGIYPWRDGVVISAAPDVFYAEDTNRDGKADVREVLFRGFAPGNQQHRVNGFDYGLDGWLYGANGDSGGTVKSVGGTSYASPVSDDAVGGSQSSAARGVNLRGRDFRIQPDKRVIEPIEGQTQFGRHRDDFGNWFGNNNPTWLWHYYFPERYLARNPFLPLKTTKKLLANYDQSTRCFPISRTVSRFNDAFAAGHVTSGCSATPYRDELFGKSFESSVFISEPVHNLVHHEVLQSDGVTFSSHRSDDERTNEFLASSDNWFRPTMLKTGPDGALYVADMYRLVIEHPEWIPAEMQARLDLRAGADMGRIYRVYPEGGIPRRIPNLAKLSAGELADALDSPSGWERDTVQRLLIERGDKSVAAKIERLVKNAEGEKVRVQALWILRGLNALNEDMLQIALRDESAAVREHAVKLSEAIVSRDARALDRGSRASRIEPALLALAHDSNARVRYQLAFTLGEWNDERAATALLKLARDEDENIRNAALSSMPRHAKQMLALVQHLPDSDRARAALPILRKLVANPQAPAADIVVTEATRSISPEQRAERASVLARYADVKSLKGDAKRGAELFKPNCAPCHRVHGEGAEVGPDLSMMSGKPVEQLVEAILDPNAAFEDRYRSCSVTLRDGSDLSGIIVSETPTALTLHAPNQPEQTILRGDVKEMTASGLSLMPDGFENAFTPQQLADVIAFVLGR